MERGMVSPVDDRPVGAGKRYATLLAALAWATIIFDFCLGLGRPGGLVERLSNYAGYFTLWTNVLCAVIMTATARARWTGRHGFLTHPTTATGAAAAIIIVAAVFNLVLRAYYSPTGAFAVTNEMMHVVLPALFVGDWLFFVDKRELGWRGLSWALYPLIYMLVALVRGAITGFYPYPFADVSVLGYPRVLLNSLVIGVFYSLAILALNAVGRRRERRRSRGSAR